MWFKLNPSKKFTQLLVIIYIAVISSIWLASINNFIKLSLAVIVAISLLQNIQQYILQHIVFSTLTKNRILFVAKNGSELIAKLKFKVFTKLFIVLGLKIANKNISIIIFNDSLTANKYRLLSGKINQLHADIGK
jgi:hypothetical protein